MFKFTGKYRLDRGKLFWMGRRFPGITIGQVCGIKRETLIDNQEDKMTNANFAERNPVLLEACRLSGIKATRRQSSKFRNGKANLQLSFTKIEFSTFVRNDHVLQTPNLIQLA